MEETLSLPVNMPFDKRAVCTKSGHEPLNWCFYNNYPGEQTARDSVFIRIIVGFLPYPRTLLHR